MTWELFIENGVSTGEQIAEHIPLSKEEISKINQISKIYPVFINSYYLSLIDPSNPDDPIRKMSIPSTKEFDIAGALDTSGEQENTVIDSMQHKYKETVMILSTNQCSMYCRHCFRRRLVGKASEQTSPCLKEISAYVKAHKEIRDVLISGGDAFLNSNETIKAYLDEFIKIQHLDYIRFGTRTPAVLPQRISQDTELIKILKHYNQIKSLVITTHFNHPKELTAEAVKAIKLLKEAGLTVLNQTVLLKGINSSPSVLSQLMRSLCQAGVIPYYVFQCRPVKGVANQFQMTLNEGYKTVKEAKSCLDGIAKSFRYVLSHPTGKIEILGTNEADEMLFKYHQAKSESDMGRIFTKRLSDECWL